MSTQGPCKRLNQTCQACAFEYLSTSCGGKGQQWLAMGTGALPAADLGGVVCGISLLGGGHY